MTNDPPPQTSVFRILDAAMNRAAEGLRVVEDFARMALDDAHLSWLAKELRHDLTTVGQQIDTQHRHAARDTPGDVGTRISTETETIRGDAWQVAAASFQRTAQALRSLEEYGKLVDTSLAAECEALRYRLYTLEKAMSLTQASCACLADVRLYVLVDGGNSEREFAARVESLFAAGVQAIQLRDTSLTDKQLLARARALAEVGRRHQAMTFVNNRPDIAMAANVDGVHLGQDDLPVAAARKIVGPHKLVGVSTHAIDQARQAVLDGANYLGAGPTFPSATKPFDEFPGLEYLEQVAAEISLPTFAIGGIDSDNVAEVTATGVSRVAVAGAVGRADNAAAEVDRLLKVVSPTKEEVL